MERAVLRTIEDLLLEKRRQGQGESWLEKRLSSLASTSEGWPVEWPVSDKSRFISVARLVSRCWGGIGYGGERHRQLLSTSFRFWIYKCGDFPGVCPDHHNRLDGVARHPSDDFWSIWSPPNDWLCDCYVVGTNSEAGVRRLGGDPAKRLPEWWDDPAFAPPPEFTGLSRPDVARIVRWALDRAED